MQKYIELIERTAKNNYETTLRMYSDIHTKLLIVNLAKKIMSTLKEGKKIMVAGNGGSAADAQHFVAELVSKYQIERRPLRAISLTTDTSVITSIGNDYGYQQIFKRQIEAIGDEGDLFLGITTSGRSENILEAMKEAHARGIQTSCLCGNQGLKSSVICETIVKVPSDSVARIQEMHGLVIHQICEIVEDSI
jgi:D-sedoheptulose 7-phosphate isomerase